MSDGEMMHKDLLRISWRQLRERRLRSILTILAVAVGVTTIISASAQVEGARVSILENLGKLGPDSIIVTVRGRVPFTDIDVARIKSLYGVAKATPVLRMNVRIPGMDTPVALVGISSRDLPDFLGELRLYEGGLYPDLPTPQAVIGNKIAIDEAGQIRYREGQPIVVQMGQRQLLFTVTGVLNTYGAAGIFPPDTSIFIPVEYYNNLVRGVGYSVVLVKAEDMELVDQVSETIGEVFGGRATITTIKHITETVTRITDQINFLLTAIASTSFIAAGLGTLNIMMISVLERVREIGILKALGMRDRGVLLIYVFQGLLIGIFGSLVGFAMGSIVAYLIPGLISGMSQRAGMAGEFPRLAYSPIISPSYLAVASLISIMVTLLATAYPSWRASKLKPVEALRYG
ncbi:MAG: FtsX-like permease family protein [Candidatus Bathyarchaeia archaeon]|nr:ABC transporter permease [Candidatus Bathyarchaeota archaeon]